MEPTAIPTSGASKPKWWKSLGLAALRAALSAALARLSR